jgi:hypothetical protein
VSDPRFFCASEFEADRLASPPRPRQQLYLSRAEIALIGINALFWGMMILRVALAAYHGRLG